ncbi:MAG: hypothetical protein LUI60_03605 [Clostridia bacterium]|nr:hypothetical protein [Clostridia bacterium]
MDKYSDNSLVEPMDDIILLNDNYADIGLYKGYIGVTVASFIPQRDYILADFFNPFSGKDIAVQAKIRKKDFKVLSHSTEDKLSMKEYKDLFRNK